MVSRYDDVELAIKKLLGKFVEESEGIVLNERSSLYAGVGKAAEMEEERTEAAGEKGSDEAKPGLLTEDDDMDGESGIEEDHEDGHEPLNEEDED